MKRSPLLRYGGAVLAVALVLLLKVLLDPLIVQETPFLLVFAAVIFSAWYGGLGPGLLATILAGFATDYFFLTPRGTFSDLSIDSLPLLLYTLEGLLINWVVVGLRSAKQRAETSTLEARMHQEDLLRSEERFRLLVEGVRDYSIIMLDPNGLVVSWNAGAERITGYKSEEIVGESFSRFHTDEDIRRGDPERELETAATEGRKEEEGCRVRKDGSRYWASVVITALRDEVGNLRGFSKVMQDISERRRVEEAIRESEERHRAVVEQTAEGIFLADTNTKRILDSNAAFQDLLGYTSEELHEMTVYDIVTHDRTSVDLHTQRTREKKNHFIGNRQYRRKDGSLIDVEVNVSMIHYGGREVMSVIAHDITERKRAEERLRGSLNSLLALYEAGQILGSTLEREEIGSSLLQIMQRVSRLEAGVISLRDERGQLRVWQSVGPESLWQWAQHTNETQDVRREVLETENQRLYWLQRPGPDETRLVGLCIPLRVRDLIIGVLEAYGPEALAEESTVGTLASLGSQAASALENGRLYGELAERERQLKDLLGKLLVAQEEERRRVAYDIHDGLTQVAVGAYQHLQSFAEDHPPHSTQGREQLDHSLELARQTVGEARQVIANLRPTTLDDFGLADAIRLQVEALRSEGWQIGYEEMLGDERLPGTLETALYRITQEALTNVRKHARTTRVAVSLRCLEGAVRLQVTDWGRGFHLTETKSRGGLGESVGLSSMQERVALLNGNFEIRSNSGEGTSIVAEVPLPASQEEKEEDSGE
jgi:PAS domain S-box-containing protein